MKGSDIKLMEIEQSITRLERVAERRPLLASELDYMSMLLRLKEKGRAEKRSEHDRV